MAIDTKRRFERFPFYQRGSVASVAPVSPSGSGEIKPEPPMQPEEIIRFFVSVPAYALAERSLIAGILARMNAALAGKLRMEAIGQTEPGSEPPAFTAADCDAVIALMRPRLASDVTPSASGDASQGGVSGVLSAVQGRKADAGLPDIYIFRYADPNDIDADWEGRKQVFDGWFRARGGRFLAFEDFFAPTEFADKLEHQLRSWLGRLGHDLPVQAPVEDAQESIAGDSSTVAREADLAVESEVLLDPEGTSAVAAGDIRPESPGIGVVASDAEPSESPQDEDAPPDAESPVADSAAALAAGGSADQEPIAASDDLSGAVEHIVDDAPAAAETTEETETALADPEHIEPPEAEIAKASRDTPTDIEISVTDGAVTIDIEDGEAEGPAPASDHLSALEDHIVDDKVAVPEATDETKSAGLEKSAASAEAEIADRQDDDTAAEIDLLAESELPVADHGTSHGIALSVTDGAVSVDEQVDSTTITPQAEITSVPHDAESPAVSETTDDGTAEGAGADPISGDIAPETQPHDPAEVSLAGIEDESKPEVSSRSRGRRASRKSSKTTQTDDTVVEVEPVTALETGAENAAEIVIPPPEATAEEFEAFEQQVTIAEPAETDPAREIAASIPSDTGTISVSESLADALPASPEPSKPTEAGDLPHDPAFIAKPISPAAEANVVALAAAFVQARRQREELDAKYRALEAEASDAASEALQREREAQIRAEAARKRTRRVTWAAAAAAIAVLAVVGVEWRSAAIRRDRAEQNLAAAADRAGTLVSELAKNAQQPSGGEDAANKVALDKARSLLGDLASAGKFDPVERKTLADSLMASADSLLKEGKIDDALKAATQAREILHTLSTAEPNQPEWLTRLAQSDSTIGEMYFKQKNLDEALGSFREALAIRRALALKEPGDPERQKALASTQQRTGDMQLEKGRLEDALSVYRDAQAIYNTLAQGSPDSPDTQRSLIEIDDAIGDTLTAENHLDDALGVYRDELGIAQHMARKAPDEPKWQRAIALADNKVGDVLLAKERIDDAIAAYRDGMTVVKALAAKDSASSDWQSMSATGEERIGDALAAETHNESALAAYNEALASVVALAAKDPGNGEWQRGISETQLRIGWVLFKQGKIDASIAAHRESLAVVKAMIAKQPDNIRWRRDLMLDDGKIAQLLMAQGNHTDALPIYQEALSIAKEMAPKDPGNSEWQSTRAVVDSNVGRLLMETGKQDEALVAYRDARSAAETLALKDPASVDWQTGLVIAYYNLAEAGDDTNANLLRASEILKRLDAAGVLPADKKMLIGKIDEELDGSTRQVKHR